MAFKPFDPLGHIAENIGAHGYKSAPATRVQINQDEIINITKVRARSAGLEVNGEMGAIMLAIFSDLSNVYITGGAGTGKTTFLKTILIPELEHRGLNYHVTASTGIAGSHVDGKTLHSFLGIGLGPEWPPGVPILSMELDEIEHVYEATYQRWQNNPRINSAMRDGLTKKLVGTEVILLEEVSMISGWGLMGYVDFFLKKLRRKAGVPDKPFGGIQMIFIGDFGQLPPVEKYQAHRPDWAFMCQAWKDAKVRAMKFTKIHRQKEGWFTDFLNETRDGIPVSPANRRHLTNHLIPGATPHTHPNFTFLCATNKEADSDNVQALAQYPGETVEVQAVFDVREDQMRNRESVDEVRRRLIESKSTLRAVLNLRIGLPVLLTVNSATEGYVNGTKGFVHRFVRESVAPFNVTIIEVRVPSKRWTQRQRDAFTPEERERVESYDTTHAISMRFWSRSSAEDPEELMPIDVKFFTEEIATGRVPPVRHRWPVIGQFPIIPASVITVHRAQGMSLDDVVVRVDRAFAPGQVYVALSRLRAPDGLVITSLDLPIFADTSAAAFNQTVQAPCVDMGEPLPDLEEVFAPVSRAPVPVVAVPAIRILRGVDWSKMRTVAAPAVIQAPIAPHPSNIRGKTVTSVIVDDVGPFGPPCTAVSPEQAAADAAADRWSESEIPY